MKRKFQGSPDSGVPEWIVTFADLMTLLFCFFVLLTTLSTKPKNCIGIQNYLNGNRKQFKHFELHSSKLECILSLPSDFLFTSGSDEIQRRAFRLLIPLFTAIKTMDEHKDDLIIVEGHTDNVPIKTRKFSSNWELSSARATNMAVFLIHRMKYKSESVSLNAYAENRPKIEYKDEVGNKLKGKELRHARLINRRVEILFVERAASRKTTRVLFDGQ